MMIIHLEKKTRLTDIGKVMRELLLKVIGFHHLLPQPAHGRRTPVDFFIVVFDRRSSQLGSFKQNLIPDFRGRLWHLSRMQQHCIKEHNSLQ